MVIFNVHFKLLDLEIWAKHVWPISPDLVIQNGCSHRRIGAIVHPHLMVILNYFISQICVMQSLATPLLGHRMASFSITGNHNLESYYIWTPPPPTWTPMPIPNHVNHLLHDLTQSHGKQIVRVQVTLSHRGFSLIMNWTCGQPCPCVGNP